MCLIGHRRKMGRSRYSDHDQEGFVVRLAERFHFSQFRRAVAKYVREGWVPEHGGQWRNQHLVTNELARDPSKRILPKNFF